MVVLGYILIVYVMINGAQRLDKRQEKNYGNNEEYSKYADNTPLIIPFITIYHIGKYKEDNNAQKSKIYYFFSLNKNMNGYLLYNEINN